MDVKEALRELGGRATSRELLEILAPEHGPLTARKMIADALRKGEIKKVPDYEKKVEVFVLEG